MVGVAVVVVVVVVVVVAAVGLVGFVVVVVVALFWWLAGEHHHPDPLRTFVNSQVVSLLCVLSLYLSLPLRRYLLPYLCVIVLLVFCFHRENIFRILRV